MNKLSPELRYRLLAMLVFALALFLPHFLWEATVLEDRGASEVSVFGSTALASMWTYMQHFTTNICYSILHFFRSDIHLESPILMRWDNGSGILIIQSCTALKQLYLQTLILLFTTLYTYFAVPRILTNGKRFPTKQYIGQAIGYLILSELAIWIFNLVRICIATWAIHHSYELYHLLHAQILRYGFYGLMFLSWVLWVEHCPKRIIYSSN